MLRLSVGTSAEVRLGRHRVVESVVLNTPNWSLELNDAFIRGAIDQGRRIYLASPTKGNLIRFAGQPTVYARELQMLRDAGYTRSGDYMVPR